MLKKILSNQALNTDLALLILRLGISFLMARHGYDKLQTLLSGSSDFPDPLHIGGQASLFLTVFAEFFCSLLLGLGLLSRLSTIPLIICMLVIVFVLNAGSPLDETEHALLYVLGYLCIFFAGSGRYSIDAVWLKK